MSTETDRIGPQDVAVSWDPPPERRRRGPNTRPGKWETFINLVVEQTNEAGTRAEKIDDRPARVGPWVSHPKDRQPTVGEHVPHDLNKVYGLDSPHHREHGSYFEIMLRDTITVPSGRGTRTMGVLYARMVTPKAAK